MHNVSGPFRHLSDGYPQYTRVIHELLGDSCVYAQVVKTFRNNRAVKVAQKLMIGTSFG